MLSQTSSLLTAADCPAGGCRQPGRMAWMAMAAGFAVGVIATSVAGAFATAAVPKFCRPLWSQVGAPAAVRESPAAAEYLAIARKTPRQWSGPRG